MRLKALNFTCLHIPKGVIIHVHCSGGRIFTEIRKLCFVQTASGEYLACTDTETVTVVVNIVMLHMNEFYAIEYHLPNFKQNFIAVNNFTYFGVYSSRKIFTFEVASLLLNTIVLVILKEKSFMHSKKREYLLNYHTFIGNKKMLVSEVFVYTRKRISFFSR